ncbi:choice-of-anchor J domain-containing protein [Flavobacterium sp. HSC-61S13]|uniref:choice-of-anchor J domain-containing protein n=1 Tax=Flavobacterium sp. HSC-61S13 TaxID=2910963 RepID=UPI0020A02FD2|nr:choice-of-anchor J domain-containing protein [Flavobacterium sp. HSC-61S13]MCP1995105.1 gliding motility-associated-like protein [Flavobacterium sp. HSC-61S13]
MSKITSFISVFCIYGLLFLSASANAKQDNLDNYRSSDLWHYKSFAPDLNLQPYFSFAPVKLLAAAPCTIQSLPFWEGFNSDSTTFACWSIVDNNKDSNSPTGNNIWKAYTSSPFEGDRSMYFTSTAKSDDWLISPTFKLDATKTYKLKYRYKSTTGNNEFEVVASNKGVVLTDFTQTIVATRVYKNSNWREETVFITKYGGDVNLAWHIATQSSTTVYIDNVSLEEVACVEPLNLEATKIKTDEVTLSWTDTVNTNWEYFIEKAGGNGPIAAGTLAVANEVVATKDHTNKNLEAGTEYEYFVRSKCANGSLGDWMGPVSFRTLCKAVSTTLVEGFNVNSTNFKCWKILDNNKDATAPTGDNIWKQYSSSPYEGDRSMFFYGANSSTTHDDWLISPMVKMNGGLYAITFYYKTSSSYSNDFEVLLSRDGINPVDFKKSLSSPKKRNTSTFVKETLYVNGEVGDINIAWHVVAKGYAYVYIDLVTIQEVSCYAPAEEIVIGDLEKDSAKISWTDPNNTSWEYFVQPMGAGPAPIGSGVISKIDNIKVLKTSGTSGANLQPNTWYEFFVRSSCGAGKNSIWVGPVKFKTPCDLTVLPLWEGFNVNSTGLTCWKIVDNNNDGDTYSNIWRTINYDQFEGDQTMYYYGYTSSPKHDDWLISTGFKLDATKYYRLKYHYKTSSFNKTDFEVLLSTKGTSVSDFTRSLITKTGISTDVWAEESLIIGATAGTVNLAWHVNSPGNSSTYLYIDNVFVEEIVGCPEPMGLGSKDSKENSASIFWSDDFGKDWEYVVQKAGGKAPTSNGTATTKKDNIVTKDQSGGNLEENTAYEFYVRTTCGDGTFSIWKGPFNFRTGCSAFAAPFWEGFNANSIGIYCWTILDENKDATSSSGRGIWSRANSGQYEGSHAMFFYTYNGENEISDDWLISPVIKLEKNKIYRLKYHFVTDTYNDDNEFEVLASNTGNKPADFKKEIVKSKTYKIGNYQQRTAYIADFDGNVNLAWHIKGGGSKRVYIDNVFVEEVLTCPEPILLDAKDIEQRKATITWTDDFKATNWEYVLQEAGKGAPTGNGTLTTKKENTLTQDQTGKAIEPNTDYEYYVRTICSAGVYSIWSGPFNFTTLCDLYAVPFWEGFNTDSRTTKCWTIVDAVADGGDVWNIYNYGSYEGNGSMAISVWDWTDEEESDDWLISPDIDMENSDYVLKYHYKAGDYDAGRLEVLLSNTGLALDQFKTKLVAAADFTDVIWKEKVVFFKGVKGRSNLAWRTKTVGSVEVHIDNIFIKKVIGCPEPFYLVSNKQTASTLDVEWQQTGGVTSWELIVVEYGKDVNSAPIKSLVVNGNPKTTISGLDQSKAYTIYVRAKCTDGKSNSDWSSPLNTGTTVGANDECVGAVQLPVNATLDCVKSLDVSLMSATKSTLPTPACANASAISKDAWFEFTATSKVHLLTMRDLISISGSSAYSYVYVVLYDQPCNLITTTSLGCYDMNASDNEAVLRNLTPGNKYYIRIGVDASDFTGYLFNLCLTTSPNFTPIEVSPSGDKYTVEELVKDVLVKSNCDLVSNVKYQNGDGGTASQKYNTVGYFNKAGSDFPFKEGIVLATNELQYVAGPYMGYSSFRGANNERWVGDKDINDAIEDAGGANYPKKRVTQIEFDFIPIKEEIKFDYLFASNSYHQSCGEVCKVGALFAAWLVDSTTGEGQNLAKVSGTETPISINTIRDADKSGASCGSENPEWFWKYYDKVDNALEASIDFVGLTKAMSSESVKVVPGRKYHIKLAVIDFCPTQSHTSAVYFNAGSFDLGNLDLGADMLVENGSALCNGESRIISSGLGTDGVSIKWYRDGVLIPEAVLPDLEVFETGDYKVVGKYLAINCEVSGSVKVEIYPAISTVLTAPTTLPICRKVLTALTLDLTEVEVGMLAKVDPVNYRFTYYKTKADAETKKDSIVDPKAYQLETTATDVQLYVYVEDVRTGCWEIFEWTLRATKGIIPDTRDNVKICATYMLPELEKDQYYYTESAAKGINYKAGDVLTEPKEHNIYVLQDNGNGCYEEISYKVTITAAVKADVFADVELECSLHVLAPLSAHNKYFTQAGGQGMELIVGSLVPFAQIIYVYAASDDGLCLGESSFRVSYKDCPIVKGISPNGDGLNDRFDLKEHGVSSIVIYNRYGAEVYSFQGAYTDQWSGQDKANKQLPDGTYYYVVIAHGKTRTGWVQINK